MNNQMDCEIIRDLLPSYVDGLTSEKTNSAVQAHCEACRDCAQTLARMREPEWEPQIPAEVDYLKRVRRRTSRKGLLLGLALLLCGLSLFAFRIFYVGYEATPQEVLFDTFVEGDEVKLTAQLASSGLGIARMTFSDSNGMVQVKVYTAPVFFFNHGDAVASYTAGSAVGRVSFGERILWEDGVAISPTAARLYAAANPFVGDMSANASLAAILGVSDQLGDYTNRLQTEAEPYGWTLCLQTPIAADELADAREIMTADAYVLLAAVENLGTVTWEYQTGDGAQVYEVTATDATAYAGCDIKSCARSASALQALLDRLSIKRAGVTATRRPG